LLLNRFFLKYSSRSAFSLIKPNTLIGAFILSIASFSAFSIADSTALQTPWQQYKVKSGDNLSTIFNRAGLSPQDVLRVSNSTKSAKTFVRMIPGETLALLIKEGDLQKIRYAISPTTTIVLTKVFDAETDASIYQLATETKQLTIATAAPTIDSTLTNSKPEPEPMLAVATQHDPVLLINPANYNAIERQNFTVSSGDSLSTIFDHAGLAAKHLSYLDDGVKNSSFALENPFSALSIGDSLSLLIVDDSLLELIHTNQTGITTKVTRSLDSQQLYVITKMEPQPDISAPLKISLASALADTDRADHWIYYTVQPTDNLSTIFMRAGLSHTDVYYVNNAAQKERIFQRMMPNEKVGFLIRDGHLIKIKYILSPLKSVLFKRTDKDSYAVKILERTPTTVVKQVAGQINSSLFVDALNAGLSNSMTMNFAKVFAWDVDFSQDIQVGDKFKLIYEELTIDGKKIKDGNIIAAQFDTGGQSLIGIFYRDSEGGVGFYTPEGRSMRKAFLRMPVEFARISSKFNLRRKHPIYNKIRAHRGVDYAAKRGTPIMASGNGKISYLGRRGAYGKTIIIQHGTSINTLYAHMSGYNKELKVGSRVKQGQIIGYVGATGAVTGAHLHYEFRVDGIHKNPLTVKLPKATNMPASELESFKLVADSALKQLNFTTKIATSGPKIASIRRDTTAPATTITE